MIEIIIKENLDQILKEIFEGMKITSEKDRTILTSNLENSCITDDILKKINDFNLTLISVNRYESTSQNKEEKTMKNFGLFLLIVIMTCSMVFGQPTQEEKQKDFKRHSIGSSLWMAYNFFEDPADYYILNYGYRLDKKNKVFVEAYTWKYPEPMGTYGDSDEEYPGEIRAFGIGVGYQRLLWKNLFFQVHVTPMLKQYNDEDGDKIQNGFLLYTQTGIGYKFEFFNDRWFLEPAWLLKYWPIDTNFPKSFEEVEDGAPKYIFEPALNFGFTF